MLEVTESVTIKASPDEVWAFISEPENNLLVSSNLESFERLTEGPIRVGTLNRGVVKVAGRRIEWTTEVTRYDEGKQMNSRSLESPIEFTYDISLDEVGDGTKMTVHQEMGSLGGFFGKLADPLVLRMYRKDVRATIENTKEFLEA